MDHVLQCLVWLLADLLVLGLAVLLVLGAERVARRRHRKEE